MVLNNALYISFHNCFRRFDANSHLVFAEFLNVIRFCLYGIVTNLKRRLISELLQGCRSEFVLPELAKFAILYFECYLLNIKLTQKLAIC